MDNLNHKEEIAVFAGGCFWCTEPVFSQLTGVHRVASGYTGGHTPNPTYKDICRGDTGHAEAIQIHFNPQHISYETLLEIFFASHDPTTLNRQGNDIGTQYRSAIFCQTSLQKSAAIECISRLDKAGIWLDPIVTQINDADTFYPAEDYHQYYFAKNPFQPYCLAVAAPKAAKIREKYAHLIKNS